MQAGYSVQMPLSGSTRTLLLALPALALGVWLATRALDRDTPGEITVTNPAVADLHTAFRESPKGVELSPQQAFGARELCPRFTRARYQPGQGEMGLLSLEGEHLDRVTRVAALRQGLPVAEAVPHAEPGGRSLQFAVGCRDCAVVLGLTLDGLQVACTGPGHSLTLTGGVLSSP